MSGHAAIANWKLLFIGEGAPTIAMAFIAFSFMPDSPEQARFLNEEEKELARARAISQVGTEGSKRIGGVSRKDVGAAVIDTPNWFKATGPRYSAVYPVAVGIFPAVFNSAPKTLNNQGSDSARRTGIALLQMEGQCGPLLSTRLYPVGNTGLSPMESHRKL